MANGSLEQPKLHALAFVDKIEPDPAARHMRIVHGQINLAAADSPGVEPPLMLALLVDLHGSVVDLKLPYPKPPTWGLSSLPWVALPDKPTLR